MDRGGGDAPGPERARDDTDVGWGGPYDDPDARGADRDDDRRLLEERPPHHDRP